MGTFSEHLKNPFFQFKTCYLQHFCRLMLMCIREQPKFFQFCILFEKGESEFRSASQVQTMSRNWPPFEKSAAFYDVSDIGLVFFNVIFLLARKCAWTNIINFVLRLLRVQLECCLKTTFISIWCTLAKYTQEAINTSYSSPLFKVPSPQYDRTSTLLTDFAR